MGELYPTDGFLNVNISQERYRFQFLVISSFSDNIQDWKKLRWLSVSIMRAHIEPLNNSVVLFEGFQGALTWPYMMLQEWGPTDVRHFVEVFSSLDKICI